MFLTSQAYCRHLCVSSCLKKKRFVLVSTRIIFGEYLIVFVNVGWISIVFFLGDNSGHMCPATSDKYNVREYFLRTSYDLGSDVAKWTHIMHMYAKRVHIQTCIYVFVHQI